MSEPIPRDHKLETQDDPKLAAWLERDYRDICINLQNAMDEFELRDEQGKVDVIVIEALRDACAALAAANARAESAERKLAAIAEKAEAALYPDVFGEDYRIELEMALEAIIEAIAKGE